jgi:transcription elongation factor Elf1
MKTVPARWKTIVITEYELKYTCPYCNTLLHKTFKNKKDLNPFIHCIWCDYEFEIVPEKEEK